MHDKDDYLMSILAHSIKSSRQSFQSRDGYLSVECVSRVLFPAVPFLSVFVSFLQLATVHSHRAYVTCDDGTHSTQLQNKWQLLESQEALLSELQYKLLLYTALICMQQ